MKKLFQCLLIVGLFSCNVSSNNIKNSDKETTNSIAQNTVMDIDGNTYQTVKIAKHIWLKENLKVTHYRNGDDIPNIIENAIWDADKKGAYCNYNNDTALARIYGRLYNWYAVNDERNICPVGWHVATTKEFSELNDFYGGTMISGMQLKESGAKHWGEQNNSSNGSNFTALPGGHRYSRYSLLGEYTYFWNREEYLGENCSIEGEFAYECSLHSSYSYFNLDWGHKSRGMSVRCVKDTIKID